MNRKTMKDNRTEEQTDPGKLRHAVLERLKQVIDPETGMDVISMKLIPDLQVDDSGGVSAVFRPSSPVCPLAVNLAINIKKAIREVPGISEVELTVVDFVGQKMLNEQLKLI